MSSPPPTAFASSSGPATSGAAAATVASIGMGLALAQQQGNGSVQYCFRHEDEWHRVSFRSAYIAVMDLKKYISDKQNVDRRELHLIEVSSSGQPGQQFDIEDALIPAGTRIMVIRTPFLRTYAGALVFSGQKSAVATTVEVEDALKYGPGSFQDPDAERAKRAMEEVSKEVDAGRNFWLPVPAAAVCVSCNALMERPMLLTCCGRSLCWFCVEGRDGVLPCPHDENRACRDTIDTQAHLGRSGVRPRVLPNKKLEGLIINIVRSRERYNFADSKVEIPTSLLESILKMSPEVASDAGGGKDDCGTDPGSVEDLDADSQPETEGDVIDLEDEHLKVEQRAIDLSGDSPTHGKGLSPEVAAKQAQAREAQQQLLRVKQELVKAEQTLEGEAVEGRLVDFPMVLTEEPERQASMGRQT